MLVLALGGGDCRVAHTSKQGTFDVQMVDGDGVERAWMPLAAGGAQVAITAYSASRGGCSGQGASFAQVASSDPSIATFTLTQTPFGNQIDAVTAAPGEVELQLLDSGGRVVDTVAIDVEEVARIELANGSTAQVLAGGTYTNSFTVKDANGDELVGAGAVQAQAQGQVTASVMDQTLTVTAAGSGTVTLSATDATTTLDVLAVTRADITSIALGTGEWAPSYDASSATETIWATPMTAGGAVYGVGCGWQVDDRSVHVTPGAPPTDLDDAVLDSAQLELTQPGTYTATCTIGSAQLQVTLQR